MPRGESGGRLLHNPSTGSDITALPKNDNKHTPRVEGANIMDIEGNMREQKQLSWPGWCQARRIGRGVENGIQKKMA